MTPLRSEQVAVKFDLTLEALEQAEGLSLSLAYNRDLFAAGTIARMGEHLGNLVRGVVADPETKIEMLPLLSESEREQLLRGVNATATEYPRESCLHELFEAQVERSPEAVAVVFEGRRLSYRELNEQANQLAHYLRGQGVRADTLVGLCVERSLEMVVGLLGILKAGGGYVPLEPTYPQERLDYMIADSAPALVLTQGSLRGCLAGTEVPRLLLDEEREMVSAYPTSNPLVAEVGVRSEHLAYVIYTSGSTGKPKGVMISHRNVSNLFWGADAYLLDEEPGTWLAMTSVSFDISVVELLWTLTRGFRVIIQADAKDVISHDADHSLSGQLKRYQVTHLQCTPSLARILLLDQATRSALGSLRHLVLAGESLSSELAAELQAATPAKLSNLYGPTETTIYSTAHSETIGSQTMPIGKPVANTEVYLLDPHLEPVPLGVPGEIYIGGAGVGRGYLQRPELTAEKFIPDLFGDRPGERLYRTGDVARYQADGNIEFLGRIDQQVKLRGFRIELGEIEAVLKQHASVREAVVVTQEIARGEQRLVAHVQLREGEQAGASELRAYLKERVPDYMVPGSFMEVTEFALTPNGKVDRKALPMPDAAYPAGEYVAPNNSTETALQAIWLAALAISSLSVTANFFESGGHSILAMHLIAQVNKNFGDVLELRDIFQMQTVREMAAYLDAHQHLKGEKKTSSGSNLLELKPGQSSARPLFLVHPVGGYAHCYSELANNLDYHGPVFGLQVDGIVPETIEAMATKYIEAIKFVQPEGPYLLGGWSMGGVVAYEMAQRLNSAQENVDLLLMLDSSCFPMGATDTPPGMSTADERALLQVIASELGITDQGLSSSEKDALNEMALDELLVTVLRLGKEQNRLPVNFDLQELRERYAVTLKNIMALRAYRPMPLDIEIQLIRAEGNENLDWDLGWSSVAAKVSVTKQSGDHLSMMHRPHLSSLAKTVNTLIQANVTQAPVPSTDEWI